VFIQQWDGKNWKRVSDLIPPMTDAVRPLLEKAAEDYLKDKPNWQTQTCGRKVCDLNCTRHQACPRRCGCGRQATCP
jgi:hypothetical protein